LSRETKFTLTAIIISFIRKLSIPQKWCISPMMTAGHPEKPLAAHFRMPVAPCNF
jgi:hypothetical protein